MTWQRAHFASTISQMKSTSDLGRSVTQSVDDVCYFLKGSSRLLNVLIKQLCTENCGYVLMGEWICLHIIMLFKT